MNARKKLHVRWDRELKQWWIEKGYPQYCEICGGTFGLSLAHSLKRRFIDTREKYFEVAALCQIHHEEIEHSGHENMYERIREIINAR